MSNSLHNINLNKTRHGALNASHFGMQLSHFFLLLAVLTACSVLPILVAGGILALQLAGVVTDVYGHVTTGVKAHDGSNWNDL